MLLSQPTNRKMNLPKLWKNDNGSFTMRSPNMSANMTAKCYEPFTTIGVSRHKTKKIPKCVRTQRELGQRWGGWRHGTDDKTKHKII